MRSVCLLTNAVRDSTKASTVIIYVLHQIFLLITSSNLQEIHEIGNFPSLSSLRQREIKNLFPNCYVEDCSPNDCHCLKAAVSHSCQDINERLNRFLLKQPLPRYVLLELRLMPINNIIMVELAGSAAAGLAVEGGMPSHPVPCASSSGCF